LEDYEQRVLKRHLGESMASSSVKILEKTLERKNSCSTTTTTTTTIRMKKVVVMIVMCRVLPVQWTLQAVPVMQPHRRMKTTTTSMIVLCNVSPIN
jgi:hypothetical protein